MKKNKRLTVSILYVLITILVFFLFGFISFRANWSILITDIVFWITFLLYLASINEFYHWTKNGRRSEMSDLVAIAFFFFLIFFITRDIMTSLMGSFSIYLWAGVAELKDYPVVNKILIISLVTYNIIFIAGLISFYLQDPFILNTTFAFSFWIILGLGFLLFGRKYIVVWRFLSPAYLTLFLYIIAWLAVGFINQYTPLTFTQFVDFNNITLLELIMNIYFVLIVVNWIIYFISGPILDKMLGIKRVEDIELLNLVDNVKKDIGIKGKVKVGFGKYPILNAMAYGSVFDKRIAIIAENKKQIPEDELKGIVGHELAHTKGRHTLILTFITSADLVMRMIFGLPATYYDYTFGEPRIPLISFIFLNIGIYVLLYIFVRILEGKADLRTKKIGYRVELAKALYNLESFYASGREVGLNTMLLCDERITENNQLLDYIDTARYINKSLIKPSRGSLLGNFINSHPPTYHRIAAILGDELKPGKEALLPFICLKRSKQKKYAKKFESARRSFKEIANKKFKSHFKIENINSLMEGFKRKELFIYDLNKEFLFRNKITGDFLLARLDDIQFKDDICDIDQLIITNLKTSEKMQLNDSIYISMPIKLNEIYFFQKDTPLLLKDIAFNKDYMDGNYIFLDTNNHEIKKSIKNTKLPNSMNLIKNFKDNDVIIKLKDKIEILYCKEVIPADNYDDYTLELLNPENGQIEKIMNLKLGDLIISPQKFYISISKTLNFRESEKKILKWLMEKEIRTSVYVKKPVNNSEIGYIKAYNVDLEKTKNKLTSDKINDQNFIKIKNIFGEEKIIPYNTLELLSFQYETAMLQKKSETSIFSKIGYKIIHKFKPQKVFY